MAGVTDAAFRRIVAKYGKPDVLFTEFTSCDGLCSAGRDRLLPDLLYHESERPVVAQIFGSDPENFYKTAVLVRQLGFDGIDINTGCPDKSVEKQGAGAALIREPRLAREIIRATQRGAGDLPVSVKTRLGYNQNVIGEWVSHLLEEGPAAITIHARTRVEMSKVPARWHDLEPAVRARDQAGSSTLILGNGDIGTISEAGRAAAEYGLDGVMIGRGIYGNPWLFNRCVSRADLSINQRLDVLVEHARLFEITFNRKKHFAIMRKFFSSYVSGVPSARLLKSQLMETDSADEVAEVISDYLNGALMVAATCKNNERP